MAPKKAMKTAQAKKAAGSKKAKKEETKVEPKKEEEEPEEEDDEEDDDDDDSEMSEAEAEAATKPKKVKTKANRLEEMQEKDSDDEDEEDRGVIYLGHIPKGFEESQMRKFFDQFGTVTRLRLSRSKRNAAPKGYGFIEFEEESVAKIVAQTMDKYLLFEKQLVCHLIPKEKVQPGLFKGWKHKMVDRSAARRAEAKANYNDRPSAKNKDGEEVAQLTRRQASRRNKSEKKLKGVLAGLGVDFDVEASGGGPRLSAYKPKTDKQKKEAVAKAVAAARKLAEEAKQGAGKNGKASPKAAPKASPKVAAKEEPKSAPAKSPKSSPKLSPKVEPADAAAGKKRKASGKAPVAKKKAKKA